MTGLLILKQVSYTCHIATNLASELQEPGFGWKLNSVDHLVLTPQRCLLLPCRCLKGFQGEDVPPCVRILAATVLCAATTADACFATATAFHTAISSRFATAKA